MTPFKHHEDLATHGSAAIAAVPTESLLDVAIERACDELRRDQFAEGYWCYEFEADCTIPAEYVLLMHYLDEIDESLEVKIGNYLRARQDEHGGWSLYPGGTLDVSCSVKAYYALKLLGDDPGAPHMVVAREAILARGGAVRANVFTHIALALFEQMPWRGVPYIPVEIMLLPRWFPFHIQKVSYWSRTVMVPLFVLCTLKRPAVNPRNVDVSELFVVPPDEETDYFPVRSVLNRAFRLLDLCGRAIEPFIPPAIRAAAVRRAESFVIERMNGDHGIGGIFPAMVNALQMFVVLGYDREHPYRVQAKRAIERLLVVKDDEAYCQPCLSPIWDTGLACLALQEATEDPRDPDVMRALDWLRARQLLDEPGDWQWKRPKLRGGGWAFEFRNDHYPDIDDTPVVAWAMNRTGDPRYRQSMDRAAEWIAGMQSSCGGWASFEVDNTYHYLNEIPFADHGALLDPPTSDVTARCVTYLTQLDRDLYGQSVDDGIAYLRAEQEEDGSWFGRWGTNYIYGTWSVLTAFEMVGVRSDDPAVRQGVAFLERKQRSDGGWGEDNESYFDPSLCGEAHRSTAFQTAWAVLALLAAGEAHSPAVDAGVEFLMREQGPDGFWHDPEFTAPGFPRVFYLKYHGYTRYFPLWALARYRRLRGA